MSDKPERISCATPQKLTLDMQTVDGERESVLVANGYKRDSRKEDKPKLTICML